MYLGLSQNMIRVFKNKNLFLYCLNKNVYCHKLVSKQVFELWETYIISSQSKKKVGKLQIVETQFDQVDTAENNPL